MLQKNLKIHAPGPHFGSQNYRKSTPGGPRGAKMAKKKCFLRLRFLSKFPQAKKSKKGEKRAPVPP